MSFKTHFHFIDQYKFLTSLINPFSFRQFEIECKRFCFIPAQIKIDIKDNGDAIDGLEADVDMNKVDIQTNSANITSNEEDIVWNEMAIDDNLDEIGKSNLQFRILQLDGIYLKAI